jgi:aspartate aminotransferase
MPNISYYYGKRYGDRVISNSVDFCSYLLEEARIAVVPGSAFEAPNSVRIAYSNSLENIKRGMDNLEEALAKLT